MLSRRHNQLDHRNLHQRFQLCREAHASVLLPRGFRLKYIKKVIYKFLGFCLFLLLFCRNAYFFFDGPREGKDDTTRVSFFSPVFLLSSSSLSPLLFFCLRNVVRRAPNGMAARASSPFAPSTNRTRANRSSSFTRDDDWNHHSKKENVKDIIEGEKKEESSFLMKLAGLNVSSALHDEDDEEDGLCESDASLSSKSASSSSYGEAEERNVSNAFFFEEENPTHRSSNDTVVKDDDDDDDTTTNIESHRKQNKCNPPLPPGKPPPFAQKVHSNNNTSSSSQSNALMAKLFEEGVETTKNCFNKTENKTTSSSSSYISVVEKEQMEMEKLILSSPQLSSSPSVHYAIEERANNFAVQKELAELKERCTRLESALEEVLKVKELQQQQQQQQQQVIVVEDEFPPLNTNNNNNNNNNYQYAKTKSLATTTTMTFTPPTTPPFYNNKNNNENNEVVGFSATATSTPQQTNHRNHHPLSGTKNIRTTSKGTNKKKTSPPSSSSRPRVNTEQTIDVKKRVQPSKKLTAMTSPELLCTKQSLNMLAYECEV